MKTVYTSKVESILGYLSDNTMVSYGLILAAAYIVLISYHAYLDIK